MTVLSLSHVGQEVQRGLSIQDFQYIYLTFAIYPKEREGVHYGHTFAYLLTLDHVLPVLDLKTLQNSATASDLAWNGVCWYCPVLPILPQWVNNTYRSIPFCRTI